MKLGVALLLASVITASLAASDGRPLDVNAQAKGADHIVVGVVTDLQSRFDTNEYGDHLIFTQAWLEVQDTLKGARLSVIPVDLEGGSIGELTLKVSDMPPMRKGDRAVFFLKSRGAGVEVPHGRGNGILKLDAADRVQGLGMTLADIKAMVRSALK